MKKILAVSGSPVEGSSTDMLLDAIVHAVVTGLRNQSEECDVRFVKLNQLTFIPCQACGEDPAPKYCFFDDGLGDLLPQVAECDCLVVGTPVYFDSVSAQMKGFIDRCNCLRPPDYDGTDPDHAFIRRLSRQRPGAMVLVGGERGWFEGARRVIAGFFKWIEVQSEGMIVHHSKDFNTRGSAHADTEGLAECEAVAAKIVRRMTDG